MMNVVTHLLRTLSADYRNTGTGTAWLLIRTISVNHVTLVLKPSRPTDTKVPLETMQPTAKEFVDRIHIDINVSRLAGVIMFTVDKHDCTLVVVVKSTPPPPINQSRRLPMNTS